MEEIGNPVLLQLIREEIARKKRIPFAEYMEMSQYTPGLGYYASSGEKIGPGGDYYTSTDLHPLFGEMVGRQIAQAGDLITDGPFLVVEMGAGTGLLCQDILRELSERWPEIYSRLTYWIIERSEAMRHRQSARLEPFVQTGKVGWANGLEDHVFSAGVTGIFLSNELLDSFPVHRVVQAGESLREIYVTNRDGNFAEVQDEPSTPELTAYFQRLGIQLQDGQQAEVNLRALDWVRRIGRVLAKGLVITIDYGYPAAELYAPGRRHGTFLCYFRHRVSENAYVRVGQQDMTSHVDFTSLARAGLETGLEVSGFTSQEYFLMGLGIAQAMEKRLEREPDNAAREKELRAMKQLVAPAGLGRVFKVLIQHKGLHDPKLEGLTYRAYGAESLFSL